MCSSSDELKGAATYAVSTSEVGPLWSNRATGLLTSAVSELSSGYRTDLHARFQSPSKLVQISVSAKGWRGAFDTPLRIWHCEGRTRAATQYQRRKMNPTTTSKRPTSCPGRNLRKRVKARGESTLGKARCSTGQPRCRDRCVSSLRFHQLHTEGSGRLSVLQVCTLAIMPTCS